jgi:two-component system, LuxR family, sensor kinase FixL
MTTPAAAARPRVVLLVEDDEMHAELARRAFEDLPGVRLDVARRLGEARAQLAAGRVPDIVVADLRLPDGEGIELAGDDAFPVVIMTSQGSEAMAVEAMRAGALDYVVKSEAMFDEMPHIVERALREWQHMKARDRATRLLRAQFEIASALATSKTTHQAGPLLLEAVCRSVGWAMGQHWRLDREGTSLVCGACWPQAAEVAAPADAASEPPAARPPPVRRGEGLPGLVWERREVVRLGSTAAGGVEYGAALGYPVEAGGELFGVLAFFSHDPEPPDEELQLLLGSISSQLAVFTRHEQAEVERERLQREVEQRERLAAVGQTAAMLAHEIGNPLNSMHMLAQLLQRRLARAQGIDPSFAANLELILAENRRLNQLLLDFRSLARRREPERRPVDLPALLDRVLELQAPLLDAQGIHVRREVAAALPVVEADDAKLVQVLVNLVKNAVEAMLPGGTLTVRAAANERDVTVEIEDTGGGIPDDIDVFEPFRSTKAAGTGLGLAIAREIVQAHGGSLDYRTARGAGTTFCVVLPR